MATTHAIQVKNLTKKFGNKTALSDVSFSVPKGEIVGFLGPNGAGKTTAIRSLMDFIRPTSGSIIINGKDAHASSTELKNIIGFLPSDLQLNPTWTAEDHIKIADSVRGESEETQKLVELLDLDTSVKVKNLSTGNKQKLSIVLAFAGNPKIIIMDEPTRGLDPVLQNTIYEMLEKYTKQGNTVFFSSHNLSEVQRICDTVILIKDGKVVTEQGMKEIRGLKSHIISATTKKKLSLTKLVSLGAEITALKDCHVEMTFKGKLNPLIEYLAEQTILDIDIGHANLEDLFLEMYKD
jgi:ABC-2 type transport system ATP-binding protein